ncbi:MAG: LysM peptidoglycan-binding domain-containing protein, partial [Blautia sp.]|nr:LysM peptidoglycan-binding domain-containing protein [Blautia sp.]
LRRYGIWYLPGFMFLLLNSYIQSKIPVVLGDAIDILSEAEPAKDEAVKAFRKRIEETAEEEKQPAVKVSGSGGFLSYAATACLAFAVLAAGLNFYRSYRQAEQPERSVQSVSSDTVSSVSATPAGSSGELQNRSSVRGQKNAEDNEASDLEKSEEPKVSPKVSGTEEPDTKTKTEEISEIEKTGTETSSGKTHAKDTAAGPVHETYVIRPGDTLFQICLEHYGSLERLQKLCELNGITEHDLIYPGEILILP